MPGFDVGTDEAVRLDAEDRREADVEDVVVLAGPRVAAVPVAERRRPSSRRDASCPIWSSACFQSHCTPTRPMSTPSPLPSSSDEAVDRVRGRARQRRARSETRESNSGGIIIGCTADRYGSRAPRRMGWRAGPPALAENSCGCFLPDLTRFTTMQCGAARRSRDCSRP